MSGAKTGIPDCQFRGKMFGCKFQLAYDERLPNGLTDLSGTFLAIEAAKEKTFRGAVCVRCGRISNSDDGAGS